MDLARRSPEYMRELTRHHVGGQLKVAPEHVDPQVLNLMRKPSNDDFEKCGESFSAESQKAGKKQHLVPYFIASHPGSSLDEMIHLAVFLKLNGYRPDQVQDFIPAPMDVATAMYYTGIDPFTRKPVYVARHLRDRKLQRALMQFFKPENYFQVREALMLAKRSDLIGDGCDCLIPARPPREAVERRRSDANASMRGEYVHKVPSGNRPKKGKRKESRHAPAPGYRPGRKRPFPPKDSGRENTRPRQD
jgi:hypothetical protein